MIKYVKNYKKGSEGNVVQKSENIKYDVDKFFCASDKVKKAVEQISGEWTYVTRFGLKPIKKGIASLIIRLFD